MKTIVPELTTGREPPPWTDAGTADPHAWFASMLDAHAYAFDPEAQIWHFFSHQHVGHFLRTDEDWSTGKRLESLPPDQRLIRLLTSDGDEHARLRSKFSKPYRPKRIEQLETRIRTVCRELLEKVSQKETFDVISDVAHPLTATMICEIIGVPAEDQHRFYLHANVIREPLGRVLDAGEEGGLKLYNGSGSNFADQEAAEYFVRLIEKRRAEPQDDLVTELAKIPPDELVGQLDVRALLLEQLGAGQNTTVHLLGNFMMLMSKRPADWQRLRDDPAFVASAIEETVRYVPPLQARPRIATRDLEVDGIHIPEGSVGVGWVQAANLDPDVFDEPLSYRPDRAPNPHLGFGLGAHYCLGANLARMEARVAIQETARLIERYELTEDKPDWVRDCVLRGPNRVNISIAARRPTASLREVV